MKTNRREFICGVAAFAAVAALADPTDPQISKKGEAWQDGNNVVVVDYALDEPAIVTFDVKTNGVSIGAENLKFASGDVHKVVAAGNHQLQWNAWKAWPGHEFEDGSVSIEVRAWAVNAPPDYMVVNLTAGNFGEKTFYTGPGQLPEDGGVTNDAYKTDYLVMRRIPAAGRTFRMGSPNSETGRQDNEIPHYVSLTNDYFMGVFNLTAGQFRNIVANSPAFDADRTAFDAVTISQGAENPFLPVIKYRYDHFRGAGKNWPSDGHESAATTGSSALGLMRLALGLPTLDFPTEAEWEFACRAGTLSAAYDGTEIYANAADWSRLGWFGGVAGDPPHAVGLLEPNGFGLYDMYGNTYEWCLDWYAADETYAVEGASTIAPAGPASGDKRVVRGCDMRWQGNNGQTAARSAYRTGYAPSTTYEYIGIRLACDASGAAGAPADPDVHDGMRWIDGKRLPIEGRAFDNVDDWYDRLPSNVTENVNAGVRELKHHTAGMSFRFVTDSNRLVFKWLPYNESNPMDHMPATGHSGIDVYRFDSDRGKWLYVATGRVKGLDLSVRRQLEIGWTPGTPCLVHLPLYNGLKSFTLGVEPGSSVSALDPAHRSGIVKPVVFYGTSITHGACASRPGMAFVNMIGRDLDVPVVDLGFSGSGIMEYEMSGHLAAIDASCYVLDCLWNMYSVEEGRTAGRDGKYVEENFEPFVRNLRAKRPGVPIVFAGCSDFTCGGMTAKERYVKALFETLVAEGWENIYYLPKDGMLGDDFDGTVDGTHPNDLGMRRMADAYGAAVRTALSL